jgi:hypothetical protein
MQRSGLNDRTDLFKDVLASAASLNIALENQGELAYAETSSTITVQT